MYFLWARHDHNKIAPCGMIKVFELNWNWIELNWNNNNSNKKYKYYKCILRSVCVDRQITKRARGEVLHGNFAALCKDWYDFHMSR